MNAPLRQLLELIEAGGDLHETLAEIARAAERDSRVRCAIMLLDESGASLRCVAAPTLPLDFAAALDGMQVGGSPCGAVVHRRAPVFTRDIDADSLWAGYRDLAAGHGLRAAWSLPIVSEDDSVLGTFSLYSPEPRLPDEWQMRVAGMGATLAAMAIDRTRTRRTVRESEARYRLLWETSTDAVVLMDEHSRIDFVNPAILDVFGYAPDELIGQNLSTLQPASLREAHRHGLQRYRDSGVRQIDWRAVRTTGLHKDGHEFPVEIAFSEVSLDGARQFGAFIRDVTQRSAVEEALRQSESRYRALAENALDLVCELDAEGRFAYASPNSKGVLGYDPLQLVGTSPFDLIHPDDRERVFVQFAEAISGDAPPGTSIFRLKRQDDTWCWLEVSANFYRDEAGARHAVIVARDIGERIAIEDTLRDSEARLRSFVANAPLILFATDRDGLFTIFDGKGTEQLGIAPERFIGHLIFDVLGAYPDVVACARRVLSGETDTYQIHGQRAVFEVHHSPVLGERGEITGTIGVVFDVTARERAEVAVRKSEERYRAIYETHRVVRLLVDPETAIIEEANQAASDFYGYSREEMAGMPVSTISITPPDELLEAIRALNSPSDSIVQRKHRMKSGEIRDVELFGSPVEVEGRTLLYGIVQDVTERRWAESLVATQRQLLEMVAVGTPLAAVLERLAVAIEGHSDGAICSILLISEDGVHLQHAASPSLPDAYQAAVDGIAIGPNVGSCGAAAFRRSEVVTEDIATDANWTEYCQLALELGLRSCWSVPILSTTGAVFGTFAVYRREPCGVRARDRALVEIATHVAGIAIERERSEVAARNRTQELERMYRQLAEAHAELEDSKAHLEEKSALLEAGLAAERERARRDQLTGALNHAAIADEMRAAIAAGGAAPLAVAMVDVDGLKAANDTYGHPVGDAVLVLVAQKLMRDGAIVGRYGGDEFLALLPGADRGRAEAYRTDVLASLVGAGLTDGQTGAQVPVVASIGLAVYPEEAEAVDDLIRLSDSAMYASRRQRVSDGGDTHSRSLGSDRAAKMVGEIVPLLTSAGGLDDKLRLVAHRLSIGAGYDGVNFLVEGLGRSRQASSATNEDLDQDDLDEWNRRQLRSDRRRITSVLLQTMKPVIIDDIATTDLLPDVQREALVAGGLRSTLVAPMIWQGRLIGGLSVASKHPNAFTLRDVEFVAAVATQVTAIVRMSSLVEELQTSTSQLKRAHEGTVLMLASAAEAHDHTTGRHLQRVRQITEAIARELEYDDDQASALGMAATLHDIGKIRVPDSVLGSSNSLAETEWVLMKQHTLWGSAFLANQPGFELAASVARHHHERWDGGGYPDGLAGEDIPESAQITTVADSFDAMTNNRPYRRGRPVEDAVLEIVSCSGTQFSPRVVDALRRLFEQGKLGFVEPDEDELAA